MNRRTVLARRMSRPTIFGSYGSRASILPSVLISAIEPRSPSDRRENRFWKYSSRIDITATPPNEPSGFVIRRLSAMLGEPPRSREKYGSLTWRPTSGWSRCTAK